MADLTYQQAYQRALAANNSYSRYQDRWQFLMDSYQGGDAYRNGNYLQKYQLERVQDYNLRLQNTPLDNQCRSLINLYVSFLFRQEPQRELGSLEYMPMTAAILEDADLDGRNMNAFMKDVATWSSVFGAVWVCVSKPDVGAVTLADELATGTRPYLSLYTPLSVLDWRFERQPNGSYRLNYIKVLEEVSDSETRVAEWTPTEITTTLLDTKNKTATRIETTPNELGRLPWHCVYAERSPVRGLGQSLIDDISDQQRMIYNELSEVYDSIRLDTHPSLVATAETTSTGAAAGQIITIPENLDPNLRPYVLQFQGGQIDKIYLSIENRRKMIDAMGNVGAVRAQETKEMSGIAIETEFQLLNARLTNIADNLELGEEHIWEEICLYYGVPWDGEIKYPDDFALRNVDNELDQLAKMKTLTERPEVQTEIDKRIAEILDIEELEYQLGTEVEEGEAPQDFVPHYMINAAGEQMWIETPGEHDAARAAGFQEL